MYFSQPRKMHDWLRENYGDLVPLHFQGRDYAAVLTAAAAREVFSADPNGYDAFWKESFIGITGGADSVWVLIQEQHRRERQLFAPAVHASHFRAYGSVIRETVRYHLDQWQAGQTITAVDTTRAFALDVIMRLVFGVKEEYLMEEGREVLERLRSTVHPLIVFYPKLQRMWFPLWRRYAKARDDMYAWVDRVLAVRRAEGRDNESADVMGMLMNARDENGKPVSDGHIRVELNSVLGAGHETTAVALAWALYELGRHPQVVAKMRAELQHAGSNFDPGLVHTLPYLDAVFKETVRLHPILAECARVPMSPMQVRGRRVEAGQALVISIVGIHHDPATYPEPDQFYPERFLEREYSIYEFLPFGGGHRRCLGSGLAEYSMKIALAEIVTHWDFDTAAVDYDMRNDIAMGPKYGVRLNIKGPISRREDATGSRSS
jgi:cytochrome P450